MPFNSFSKWVHLACENCTSEIMGPVALSSAMAHGNWAKVPELMRDGSEVCCFCAEGVRPDAALYCFKKSPSAILCKGIHSGASRARLQGAHGKL